MATGGVGASFVASNGTAAWTTTPNPSATLTITTTRAIVATEQVVVAVMTKNAHVATSSVSVSDGTTTLNLAKDGNTSAASTPYIEVWSARATAGINTSATVTITQSSNWTSNPRCAFCFSLAGVATSSYVRGTPQALSAQVSANPSVNSDANPQSGDIAIAFCEVSANQTCTAGAGFTVPAGGTLSSSGSATRGTYEYQVLSAGGAVTAAFVSSSTTWSEVVIVYAGATVDQVVPATISATSSMSISLTDARVLAPSTIAASSDMAAALGRVRSMHDIAVAATSPMVAGVARLSLGNFPIPGVLDDFNRGALGANWTTPFFGGTALQITANQLESVSVSSAGNAYYSAQQFGPDVDVFVTIAAQPASGSDHPRLFARVTNPGGNLSGYRLGRTYDAAGNGLVTLSRFDTGAKTDLLVISENFNVGDKIGMRCRNSTISIYRFDSAAGAWHEIGTTADPTYVNAGYVGLQASFANAGHTQSLLDDFAAGTINVEISPATIGATSDMTVPRVGRVRPLVMPTISAVSPMALHIGTQRRFNPDLAATSDMIAAIVGQRGVSPTIQSTSDMVAALARVRHLAALIAATSDVSLALQRAHYVRVPIDLISATSDMVVGATPVTIRATSQMFAHLTDARFLVPLIVATSTAAAGIRRFRGLTPGLIATSNMTVQPGRIRHVLATIGATSQVVLLVSRQAPIAVQLSASSQVVARLTEIQALVPLIASTSQMDAALGVIRGLAPSIVATSDVAAILHATRFIAVDIIATSSLVSASPGRERPIIGTIVATSPVNVLPAVVRHIVPTLTASSAMIAFVHRQGALAPVIFSTSNMTAFIGRQRSRPADILATSNIMADMRRLRSLYPTIISTSDIEMGLARQRGIIVLISAQSGMDAELVRLRGFKPTITATSTVDDLTLNFMRGVAPMILATSSMIAELTKKTTLPLTIVLTHDLLSAKIEDSVLTKARGN